MMLQQVKNANRRLVYLSISVFGVIVGQNYFFIPEKLVFMRVYLWFYCRHCPTGPTGPTGVTGPAPDTSKFVTTDSNQTIGSKDPDVGKKTFAGGASMNGRTLENVGTPGSDGDAANKKYVDDAIVKATSTSGKYPLYPNENPVDSGLVWIDGKKVFRMTFKSTTHASSGQFKDLGALPYFNELVELQGYVKTSDNNNVQLNWYLYDRGYNTATGVKDDGTVQLMWRSNAGNESVLSNRPCVVTVYYTMK